jgi:hypothetical protein
MPSGFFTYAAVQLDTPEDRRATTIYSTNANSAIFQGEQYRQFKREMKRQQAFRHMLLVSSGNLVR